MTLVKRNGSLPMIDSLLTDLWDTEKFFGDDFLQRPLLPAVNIKETDKGYEIEMAAPGFKKDDFRISIEKGMLTVTSERKEENEEKKPNYTRREFFQTNFKRSFSLPEDVNEEKVHAEYKNGVLQLQLNKMAEPAKPVRKVLVE
ncbi:MAG: Hsp20/alpha crystallin family protein [Imperialibacter sp.]